MLGKEREGREGIIGMSGLEDGHVMGAASWTQQSTCVTSIA